MNTGTEVSFNSAIKNEYFPGYFNYFCFAYYFADFVHVSIMNVLISRREGTLGQYKEYSLLLSGYLNKVTLHLLCTLC